jgi:hypothetical protein
MAGSPTLPAGLARQEAADAEAVSADAARSELQQAREDGVPAIVLTVHSTGDQETANAVNGTGGNVCGVKLFGHSGREGPGYYQRPADERSFTPITMHYETITQQLPNGGEQQVEVPKSATLDAIRAMESRNPDAIVGDYACNRAGPDSPVAWTSQMSEYSGADGIAPGGRVAYYVSPGRGSPEAAGMVPKGPEAAPVGNLDASYKGEAGSPLNGVAAVDPIESSILSRAEGFGMFTAVETPDAIQQRAGGAAPLPRAATPQVNVSPKEPVPAL